MYGICMQNTIQGEGFEVYKPRLRGDILHYPGRGFMRDHRQMAWEGEPKRGKPIPCLAGGFFIIKHPIGNYQCTLVGVKDSNYYHRKNQNWKLEMFTLEKLSLVKRNVHIGS